jgi:D-amino-acid oxidase
MRVIVVGAGVIGLTCAVRLLEAGHRVDVVARDLPLETTSVVAAAIWYPYRALPRDKVTAWATTSYAVFDALAAPPDFGGSPESGVRMLLGTEVFASAQADPWWVGAVPGLDRETSLPGGYVDGWTFATPVVDMPTYLPWLAGRVADLGGTLTRMNLRALPEGADLVVNCST